MLSRRTLAVLLCLVLVFSLCALPAMAEEERATAPETKEASEKSDDAAGEELMPLAPAAQLPAAEPALSRTPSGPLVVAVGEVYYCDGETVYNNGGTVFNNGGTVYNNEGTVYNNSGVVYNNNGTVFNNGAEVYNNGGNVIGTGGVVHDNGGEFEDARHSGLFSVKPTADYGPYAAFEGAERDGKGNFRMDEDDKLVIRPIRGLSIEAATTTAGSCALSSEGSAVLERVNRDGELTLRFVPERPEARPGAGAYGEKISVELRASDAAAIHYTLDGGVPGENSPLYEEAISIDKSCVLRAVAVLPNGELSRVIEQHYVFPSISPVLFTPVNEGYEKVPEKKIQVLNTGAASVQISSMRLEGRNADSFILSSVRGTRIPGGQSASLWTVVPKTGLTAGKYEAELVAAYPSGHESRLPLSFTVMG